MKRLWHSKQKALLAVILGLALSILSLPSTAWSGLRDDIRDFHGFLRDHPRISADLRANPSLATSRRYLDRHDDLERFLRRRPALRDELRVNPGRVLDRRYAYDRYGPR